MDVHKNLKENRPWDFQQYSAIWQTIADANEVHTFCPDESALPFAIAVVLNQHQNIVHGRYYREDTSVSFKTSEK